MGKAKEKAAAGGKYKKAKPKISLKKEDLQWLSENTKFGQEELRSWNKVVFTKLLIQVHKTHLLYVFCFVRQQSSQ